MPRPELSDRVIIEQNVTMRLASTDFDSPRATSFFDTLAFRLTYAQLAEASKELTAVKNRSDRKRVMNEVERLRQKQKDISTRITQSRKHSQDYETEHDTWSNWLKLGGRQFEEVSINCAKAVFGEELVAERLGLVLKRGA